MAHRMIYAVSWGLRVEGQETAELCPLGLQLRGSKGVLQEGTTQAQASITRMHGIWGDLLVV